MAKKSKKEEAQELLVNANTTPMEVPQTMRIEHEPAEKIEPKTLGDGEKPELFDPNKEIMEKIYAKRRKQLEGEISLQNGFEPEVEPELKEEIPTEVQPDEVKPVAPAASSPDVTSPTVGTEPPKSMRIKVEGQEMDVPMDTLVTLAQKGLSAEQRWQEAAQMRQQAQQLMTPQEVKPAPQVTQNTTSQELMPKDKLADIVRRINYGSEDEQASALAEYGAAIESKVRDEHKALPTEQIVNAATRNAVMQVKFEQDQTIIAGEFPEIFKDKGLSSLAGQIAGEKLQRESIESQQQGRYARPIIDIWREALTETKSKYYKDTPATQSETAINPVQAAPLNDKIERKRAAPQPPTPASKVSSDAAPVMGANPSSIVDKMRKARGQPVFNT